MQITQLNTNLDDSIMVDHTSVLPSSDLNTKSNEGTGKQHLEYVQAPGIVYKDSTSLEGKFINSMKLI